MRGGVGVGVGRALGTEGEKWLFVQESLRSLEKIPLSLSKGV